MERSTFFYFSCCCKSTGQAGDRTTRLVIAVSNAYHYTTQPPWGGGTGDCPGQSLIFSRAGAPVDYCVYYVCKVTLKFLNNVFTVKFCNHFSGFIFPHYYQIIIIIPSVGFERIMVTSALRAFNFNDIDDYL